MFKHTNNARVAKLADALDLGSSGQPWGFESLHAHHMQINPDYIRAFLCLYVIRSEFAPNQVFKETFGLITLNTNHHLLSVYVESPFARFLVCTNGNSNLLLLL